MTSLTLGSEKKIKLQIRWKPEEGSKRPTGYKKYSLRSLEPLLGQIYFLVLRNLISRYL